MAKELSNEECMEIFKAYDRHLYDHYINNMWFFGWTARSYAQKLKKEHGGKMKHNYKENFNMELLKGKIVMAFTDPLDCLTDDYVDDGKEDNYTYFSDDFTGEGIHTYYVFDTPEEFISKWEEICNEPHGMWYWCLNDGECFCSGACDPNDIDIFEEYFGLGDKEAQEEDYD